MGVKDAPNAREKTLFERAKKYTRYLSYIPGIQMIAVVNSLSMNATNEESDIDLFIITRPGSIWFVRFFATSMLWILWVWRHGEDIAGNFCLSFFITTEAMDLGDITIQNDIYLFYWIYYMKPLYDAWGVYDAFIRSNDWTTGNASKDVVWGWHLRGNFFISLSNSIIRFFFLPYTRKSYEKLWKPEWVVISETMLKFHDQDRREEIRDAIV